MSENARRIVLNVGGNNKNIAIPAHFDGFEHWLLDIDPLGKPDVLCDARELDQRVGNEFDAIYCSHNLEHYFWHDAQRVLKGFHHGVKPGGFVDIRVPDLLSVMDAVLNGKVGLTQPLYQSGAGPIAPLDVIYGFRARIASSGVDYYAHKTGFSRQTLHQVVRAAGFSHLYDYRPAAVHELRIIAFKGPPEPEHLARLKLPQPTS